MVANAPTARRREFAAGRVCARLALQAIGIEGFALLAGAHRQPLWPVGVSGSISHCGTCCAAVVCNDPEIIGLGLDIERIGPVTELPLEVTCTVGESAWLDAQPADARTELAWVLFSAKESLYKALFTQYQAFIEFGEVELRIDSANQTFTATSTTSEIAELLCRHPQTGRFIIDDAFVFTGVTRFRE